MVQIFFLETRAQQLSSSRRNCSPKATAVAQFSASLRPELWVGLKLW